MFSGARVERERRRGARDWAVAGGREMLEVLREGGPRKREGGGGRFGLRVGEAIGEELGERSRGEDMMIGW